MRPRTRPGTTALLATGLALAAGVAGAAPALAGPGGTTTRVSVADDERQGRGFSVSGALSGNGRYVAFLSSARLAPVDTNDLGDVYLRDRVSGTTRLVSVGGDGRAAGAPSAPSISDDGRYVTFVSAFPGIVAGDDDESSDIYVRDVLQGMTRDLTPNTANGDPRNVRISGDGSRVVFEDDRPVYVGGDTNGVRDVFVVSSAGGPFSRVSVSSGEQQANAASAQPSISDDGQRVAFASGATNLAPGPQTTDPDAGVLDVYVRDLGAGTTRRVPVDAGGTVPDRARAAPALSGDGRHVAFHSRASNLAPRVSAPGELNVFITDLAARRTRLVSATPAGTGAGGESSAASVSRDGSVVAFSSEAATLVSGDRNGREDVFVRDVAGGTTRKASVGPDGRPAFQDSVDPVLSDDGRAVSFFSAAGVLVPPGEDTNRAFDVFVRQFAG